MTPMQIDLIQGSLPAILAFRDQAPAGSREHITVFDWAPRPLFAGACMGRQSAVLINAVAAAVQGLRSGDHLSAAALCQYHLNHGIETHHFRSAGVALARALEQESESSFTAELGDAWASACEWVGRIILEASHPMAA